MVEKPVIIATPTITGLVLRWRASAEGESLLSASRNCVMVHGDVHLETIESWLDDARKAHELLRRGKREEAAAMATHTKSFMSNILTPINKGQ